MRHVDRVTARLRQALRDWDRIGGDPDHPYAIHMKEQIARVEGPESEHRARLHALGVLDEYDEAERRMRGVS